MSQQPNSSSPKKVSPISDSATPNESTNPNRALNVSPLRMINTKDLTTTKPRTSHARRPKESVRTKGSNPSLSNPREELTKEGTRYVHNSIAKIVKRILDENHQVPGIFVPLQTVIPDPPKSKRNDNDVHTAGSDIHMTEEENNEEVQEDADNTNVTEDVNDIGNFEAGDSPRADAGIGTNVVDLDEYSDNDLLATVNPSVAERLMTRRKGKAVIQNSPVKKAAVKIPSKDSVKKKSTSAGHIKSKAKSVGVGPSKSWSKVVPKKRKARVVEESESDVKVNVHEIPLKKKPTTSKLAASVPEVPIDNVSFHFAASANRLKFVYQKRLALERELAQNSRNCKDIMDLIEAAGLIKTIVHLGKCYEMLVKEFIVNLSEECADKRSKEFRKVFVRGKCVNFSSTVINNILGRSDEAQFELEVSDNKVCQVITANQVKSWLLKGKLSTGKLSMKYAMLHKIGAANWVPINHKSIVSTVLGRFIYVVGTKEKFDYGTYIF
ncbi:uncharacterized protein LOC131604617 [Vicia villosa]|uniref:uncharacterized protein LOC131604617 n=1 Tax=Vicia villosa TaxID=3911 RepID=UPI00273CEE8A|nr:uncharacterized protein LOC131604617 [Vicia villosa]